MMEGFQNEGNMTWPLLAKEYETMIDQLYVQVDFYKTEHEGLKAQMTKLLLENEELARKVKNVNHMPKSNSKEIATTFAEANLHENLLQQISILSKEKESAINLWQESLQTIDHLESELKVYEGQVHGYISQEEFGKAKQAYLQEKGSLEQKIVDLQKENSIQKETFEICSQKNKSEMEILTEKEKKHYNAIKQLEAEKANLKIQLDNLMKEKNDVEIKVLLRDKNITELKSELRESKIKVQEACQIVDAAMIEKDAALIRENHGKEQIEEMSKRLTETVNETKEAVKKDLETMKSQYTKKLKIVYMEKLQMDEQIKLKDSQIEKLSRECKLLEDEKDRIQKGNITIDTSNTSKLLLLENNVESTFQKLLLSEKKSLQMQSERDSIKMDLEQMANNYERDIKSRDVEKTLLENKVEALQKELNLSNNQLKHVADHVKVLNAQMKSIDIDIRQKIHMKDLETKKRVGAINESHALVETEMQQNLDAQSILNKRWQTEVKDITAQFENRLRQLKGETIELKKINKKLQGDLLASQSKVMQYENRYTLIK